MSRSVTNTITCDRCDKSLNINGFGLGDLQKLHGEGWIQVLDAPLHLNPNPYYETTSEYDLCDECGPNYRLFMNRAFNGLDDLNPSMPLPMLMAFRTEINNRIRKARNESKKG